MVMVGDSAKEGSRVVVWEAFTASCCGNGKIRKKQIDNILKIRLNVFRENDAEKIDFSQQQNLSSIFRRVNFQ